MIKILTASFNSINGVVHSIKIYDNDQTGDDVETIVIAETPGYILDTNSRITDVLQGGIIESSVSFTLRNQNAILADLIEGLQTSPEGRYLVQIERGGNPFWRGILLSDFSNREDLPEGGYSFTATDGMALLDNIYVSTSNPPTEGGTVEKLIVTILRGLGSIPTINLWDPVGTDNRFLYVRTDWFGQNMDNLTDPLAQVYFKGTAMWQKVTEKEGHNGVITKIIEPLSYREMLQHTMERFNAILLMNEGAWYIMQRDLAMDSPLTFYTFRAVPWFIGNIIAGIPTTASKVTFSSVLPKAVAPDKRWRANGEFSMLPALSKVSVIYGGGNLDDGFDSIIPPGFVPGTTYTTMPLDDGTGNYLHLRVKFKEWFFVDWGDGPIPQHDFKARVYYTILVKQGNYYLKNNGEWSLTPDTASYLITPISTLRHSWNNDIGQYVLQDWVDVDWEKFSNDLPLANTEVTVKLSRSNNIVVAYGGEYFTVDINDHFNFTPDLESHFVLYIVNNEGPVAYVRFEAENDVAGFVNEFELNPSLFGSARVIQNSNFNSYSTGGWAITELWGKGYANDKDKYFNALLVHEMIGMQGKNLLMFSGDIYDRETVQMCPIHAIGIIYEPDLFADNYLLHPNKVSYYAKEEKWSGDWIQTFHLEIMPPAPLPRVNRWGRPAPDVPMDLTLLTQIIDGGTGQIDTTGGGGTGTGVLPGVVVSPLIALVQTTTPSIPTTGLISIQPNLKGELKQTDEYGNTKTVGADAVITEQDPRGVTVVGGFLYNWLVTQEATLISTAGWAVPTDSDFTTLINYLIAQGFNYDDTLTGNKIGKAVATASGWDVSATTGAVGNTDYPAKRNVTGFSLKPSGQRESSAGNYLSKGAVAAVWASVESSETLAYDLMVFNSLTFANLTTIEKARGASIRLFRAATVGEQALADGTAIVDAYTGNDGKVYQGVKLGSQIWLSENLAETKYSDGTGIPYCPDNVAWLSLTIPARCAYDNDIDEVYTDSGLIRWKDGKKMPDTAIDSRYNIIAAEYTLTDLDSFVEASSGTFAVNLPTAVGKAGRKYTVINAGTGQITLTPNGAETISVHASFSLRQWGVVSIVSNGSNWRII